MKKILIGLAAAIVVAAGGFFGFGFYVQHRAASEVEAAFERMRAAGGKASHGKVSFDLASRTLTIADIATESAGQPALSIKIANVTASGVSQPDRSRFSAETIEATDIEVVGSMAAPSGWRSTYKVPRMAIKDYSGPAGPPQQTASPSAAEAYQLALETFAAITASSVTAPSVAATAGIPGDGAVQAVDYTYSNLALRDIRDGRIAAMTVGRVGFTANVRQGARTEKISGEFENMAASDLDSSAALAVLDPARASDDRYVRAYRQITAGAYTVALPMGLRLRMDGITIDDVGLNPSKLQFPKLMSIIALAPPPGTTPTPAQAREMLEKVAGLYEGIRIGNAEIRGLAVETPEGPVKLAAIRFNLENGRIAEFAFEGLEARSLQGPVRIGRIALKSLDLANLLRVSSQFSDPSQKPSPEQALAMLRLLEGAEIKGVVAPYKSSNAPVNVEIMSLNWGQFVGPIPSKARLTVRMSGPLDAGDPELFKMLAAAGMHSASVNFDLGAAWTEDSRSFALDPVTIELSGVLSASARVSLGNVPRETFSTNLLQATVMAAQIEAGTVEVTLRDTGGVDLAVAQYARNQLLSRDAARRAIIDDVKGHGAAMAANNPEIQAVVDALTRFIETPRGTFTIKLTPHGKVPAMELFGALKADPLSALARFKVEASTAL